MSPVEPSPNVKLIHYQMEWLRPKLARMARTCGLRSMAMTDQDLQNFVTRFAAAWAARDGEAFLAMWHPEGRLHYPLVNRTPTGSEIARLNEVQKEAVPDLVWQLLDWTSRGNTVMIEWQCTRAANGKRFEWRGIDKFRIGDGQILEERVYMDTAPLRAARTATVLEPMLPM